MIDKEFNLVSGFDDWISGGFNIVTDFISSGGSKFIDTDVSDGFLSLAKSGLSTMARMRSQAALQKQENSRITTRRASIKRFERPLYSGQGGGTNTPFGYNIPQVADAHARLAARIGSGGLSDPNLDRLFRTAVNLQQGRRTIGLDRPSVSRTKGPSQPAQVTKQPTRR